MYLILVPPRTPSPSQTPPPTPLTPPRQLPPPSPRQQTAPPATQHSSSRNSSRINGLVTVSRISIVRF
ncbi:hypothetical protein WAI453_007896 [Rhynchosporium graminicola]